MNLIEVKRLTKVFYIPRPSASSRVASLFGWGMHQQVAALRNITLAVRAGECIGIIGENGSGKSTFLKLLAGILQPTRGSIRLSGSFASFLEMGLGFEREFTGRENAYLYGSFIGIPKRTLKANMARIIGFAELEKFIDLKLKYYSSGMQLRLAFSTALFADPDIYFIDEIFKVGDEFFQKRCLEEIKKKKGAGKTFVFVSHDLGQLREICDRIFLFEKGEITQQGKPDDVLDDYLSRVRKKERDLQEREASLRLQEQTLLSTSQRRIEEKTRSLEEKFLQRQEELKNFASQKERELTHRETEIQTFAKTREDELARREQELHTFAKTREDELARREEDLKTTTAQKKQHWAQKETALTAFQRELEEKSRDLERGIAHYLHTLKRHLPPRVERKEGLLITKVTVLDGKGKECQTFRTGDPFTVSVQYDATQPIGRPTFGISLFLLDGTRITGPNSMAAGESQDIPKGAGEVTYTIPCLPLLDGEYFVTATIFDGEGAQCYDYKDKAAGFIVSGGSREPFGIVTLPARWAYKEYSRVSSKKKKRPIS